MHTPPVPSSPTKRSTASGELADAALLEETPMTESFIHSPKGGNATPHCRTLSLECSMNCEASGVFIIGIAGGSASGKTSVSQRIIKNLNVPSVVLISMDSFYKALGPEAIAQASRNDYNFDHPDSFDYPLLFEALRALKQGKSVEIPIYDFTTHSRRKETQLIQHAAVVIFEGILSLYDKDVMSLFDMKIFVDTDADVRLSRRLIRDIAERGRDLRGILEQYNRFVKPSFDDFVQPTVRYADIIIPRGSENLVAIELITQHIRRKLEERDALLNGVTGFIP